MGSLRACLPRTRTRTRAHAAQRPPARSVHQPPNPCPPAHPPPIRRHARLPVVECQPPGLLANRQFQPGRAGHSIGLLAVNVPGPMRRSGIGLWCQHLRIAGGLRRGWAGKRGGREPVAGGRGSLVWGRGARVNTQGHRTGLVGCVWACVFRARRHVRICVLVVGGGRGKAMGGGVGAAAARRQRDGCCGAGGRPVGVRAVNEDVAHAGRRRGHLSAHKSLWWGSSSTRTAAARSP